MAQKNHSNSVISDRALEMVMIDVLDGMLESSLESEILSGSRAGDHLSLVNTEEGAEDDASLENVDSSRPLQFRG